MELRKHIRFPVQFKSYFASGRVEDGTGVVTDLSRGGCRLCSITVLEAGTELTLRIEIPGRKAEIAVAKAAVRWARGMQFGVEFIQMPEKASALLDEVVKGLEEPRS